MQKVFIFYGKYLKWVKMQNNLIRARNKKRMNAYAGISKPAGTELEIEPSLTGFLEWGANETA